MVTSSRLDGDLAEKVIKERFAQHARTGFPFNPVGSIEIAGANLERLQKGMKLFNWSDPRFVTQTEANENGWVVQQGSASVQIKVRDQQHGTVADIILFNAENVSHMPSLAAMLAMSDEALAKMQGREEEDELSIGPGRELAHENGELGHSVREVEPISVAGSGRFAVLAPYWKDGLHNSTGVALAEEVNAAIKKGGLAEDRLAIEKLLAIYPNVKRFGLGIVPEEQYLDNPHLKANMAEPRSLLDGMFVRDKDGSYRPATGGRTVLLDKGDSLVLKSKDKNGYAAAMELAIAKGWTAIELKGKPAMLANAWLEAKLKGLDVVNYSPTKEDLSKYSERVAKESALKVGAEQPRPMEQDPERVVVRPFVDALGVNKVATVIYTVSREGGQNAQFRDPKEAAKDFAGIPVAALPAVIRSVTRADGYVEAEVMVAGIQGPPNALEKTVYGELDHELSEAFAEVIEEEKMLASLGQAGPGVTSGIYSGKILAIEAGQVVQKVGRNPGEIVRHDIGNLSRIPKVGDVEDIGYDKAGRGMLKELGHELGRDGGRELGR